MTNRVSPGLPHTVLVRGSMYGCVTQVYVGAEGSDVDELLPLLLLPRAVALSADTFTTGGAGNVSCVNPSEYAGLEGAELISK